MKEDPAAPPGFFEAEAGGLRRLAATATVAVGEVLDVGATSIALRWIEADRPSPGAARRLGRDLGRLHATPSTGLPWGAPGGRGWIGPLPLPAPGDAAEPGRPWVRWYADERVLPFAEQAHTAGAVGAAGLDALRSACGRLEALAGPEEPAALIHGDLWSGNVVWGRQGAVLVDPSCQVGHRETDLAMLALFGAPHLDEITAGYDEVHPLAPGWPGRIGLHQLHPLLVHAVLFGSSYGDRAVEIATRMPG